MFIKYLLLVIAKFKQCTIVYTKQEVEFWFGIKNCSSLASLSVRPLGC